MAISLRSFRVFLLLIVFVAPVRSRAQVAPCDLVLSGTVRDDHDATTLAYAVIHFPELERSVTADEYGAFRVTGLCHGVHRVRVAHPGCEPVELRIELRGDRVVTLHLEHHGEELKELEVLRSKPDENVGMGTDHVDRAMMERQAGRDLAGMLSAVPGVTVLSSGPTIGKPMIHGLFGNRIVVLNQGVRQEDQQWGAEHAPGLDPLSSDRITVVKGAAAVQYGSDAIGGVVVVEPLELPREVGLKGNVGMLGTTNGRGGGGSGLLQGGVRGLRGAGWRVQGSGRYMGDAESPSYVLSNTGLRESGMSGAMGWRDHRSAVQIYYSYFQRELGILRAAHIGNLTDLRNAIESGTPWYTAPFSYAIDAPRQVMRHHLLKAEVGHHVTERSQLLLTYAYQADDRQEYDIRRAGRSAVPALDLYLATHTADVVFKHFIGKHIHGKIGVNGVHQQNTNVPGTGVRPLIPNYRKRSIGAFLLEHFPVSEQVELEAGARLESAVLDVFTYDASSAFLTPYHMFTNHALSFGLNWSIADSSRLRANISSAFRPPHVSELYSTGLHHGAAAVEQGDPSLRSEQAWKATIEFETSAVDGRLTGDLTLHGSSLRNYIYLSPWGYRLTIRGAFPEFHYVATEATLYGADATVRFALTPRWALRSRGSLVRGRDRTNSTWLFQMPADRIENALLFSIPRKGAWRGLELALSTSSVLRQERAPSELDFMPSPPAYHLLGFEANVSRTMGRNMLSMGLRGHNLLNLAYRDYLDRFRYYADARAIDVTLWIRYSFGGQE